MSMILAMFALKFAGSFMHLHRLQTLRTTRSAVGAKPQTRFAKRTIYKSSSIRGTLPSFEILDRHLARLDPTHHLSQVRILYLQCVPDQVPSLLWN